MDLGYQEIRYLRWKMLQGGCAEAEYCEMLRPFGDTKKLEYPVYFIAPGVQSILSVGQGYFLSVV